LSAGVGARDQRATTQSRAPRQGARSVHAVLAQVPTRHGPNGIVVELTHTALILALWNSLSRSNSNHSIPSYKRCSSRLLKRTELWRKRPSSRCNSSNSHTTATTLLPRCQSQSAPRLLIYLSISYIYPSLHFSISLPNQYRPYRYRSRTARPVACPSIYSNRPSLLVPRGRTHAAPPTFVCY